MKRKSLAGYPTELRTDRAAVDRNKIVRILNRRTRELIASNLELEQEIDQRNAVEKALKKSECLQSQLLRQSNQMQVQLQQLTRQVLSTQEAERKKLSHELQDVIAKTLTTINIRLGTLKEKTSFNAEDFDRSIASTQRLVEKSVEIVHRFALELRPSALDDLGLIPALHSYLKDFMIRTGVRTSLTAFSGVEDLDTPHRTVLFRVAQEALANVARHARATRVEVTLEKLPECISMKVSDDGKSFHVDPGLRIAGGKRFGLIGMRERLEMVGGRFTVESAPGKGTTILAQIPYGKIRRVRVKKPVAGICATKN